MLESRFLAVLTASSRCIQNTSRSKKGDKLKNEWCEYLRDRERLRKPAKEIQGKHLEKQEENTKMFRPRKGAQEEVTAVTLAGRSYGKEDGSCGTGETT